MRFLSFDGVFVRESRQLTLRSPRQALVRSDKGTLIADLSLAARTGTLVGFDVGESNWPLKASFVVFIRNLLERARARRAHEFGGGAIAGEPIRVSVPPHVREIEVTTPAGERSMVRARGGLAVLPNTERAGHYFLTWKSPVSAKRPAASVLIAVNLASAAESDSTRQLDPSSLPKSSQHVEAPQSAFRAHAWWLALLALGLVVLDVWYFTRKARRPALSRRVAEEGSAV
jgi:hypothetical protein